MLMKATLKEETLLLLKMEMPTLGSGQVILSMDKEHKFGEMEASIKELGSLINLAAKVSSGI